MIADLKSGDPRHELQAELKLTRMKPAAPNAEVAAALAAVLEEGKNMGVRLNAVKALEVWGTADSLPALKKATEDPNPTLQIRAREAMGKIDTGT